LANVFNQVIFLQHFNSVRKIRHAFTYWLIILTAFC